MELTIDDDFKNLIRPLDEDEFNKLESNILKEGIRDKLVVWDKTIIDGHNRYEIAQKHNLDFEVERLHFLSKEEAINWMVKNQLGRRNLTPQQRHQIFTDAEEVIKAIYEKGKEKHRDNAKRLNQGQFGSIEPNRKPPHNTNKEIGKAIGMSEPQVKRMNKLKREDEKLYKQVVEGEKSVHGAYKELPSVKSNVGKGRGINSKTERSDKNVKKKTVVEPVERNRQPPKLSQEEIDRQMFDADVSNLFMHLNELTGFVGRTEKLKEVVNEAMKKDNATMIDHIKALEEILNLTKTEAI